MTPGLHLLGKIDANHRWIITSYQIGMEFKKNRQRVIVESLHNLKQPEAKAEVPAFFKDAKAVGTMKRNVENAKKLIRSLQQRTEKLLAEPTKFDPVYKVVQRLFKNDNPFNLTRENQDRHRIRRLARHPFVLGYPPRKDGDVSVGDAVNWEWLVDCASRERTSVMVASRDSDYGATIDGTFGFEDLLDRVRRHLPAPEEAAARPSRQSSRLRLVPAGGG
jgi:hypothetical protein